MGLQQSHVSRTRRNSRRNHQKLHLISGTNCPKCGEPKRSHHVCPHCGFYKGEQVTKIED